MQDLSGKETPVRPPKFDLQGYFGWRLETVATSGTIKSYKGHLWLDKPDFAALPNRFKQDEVKL